jgi:hypothetical protein
MPLTISLVLLVAGLWCAYWYVAYRVALSTVDAADNGGSTALSCAERSLGGFPFHLTFNCRQGEAANGALLTASFGGIDASAPLFNPGHVAAAMTGPLRLDAGGLVTEANWQVGTATVDAGLSGISAATASFADLKVSMRDTSGPAAFNISAGRWHSQLRPASEPGAFRLDLATDDLVVAGGATAYPGVSGTGTLTLQDVGPAIGLDLHGLVRAWLAAGGRFRVDALDLTAAGVHLGVSGPMSLSPDGAISGAVTLRIAGTEHLPELVAAFAPAWKDRAAELADVVTAMARPADGAVGTVETRLNIRDGVVSLGIIPLVALPPLGPPDAIF